MPASDTDRGAASPRSHDQSEPSPSQAYFGFEASDLIEQAYEATMVYSQEGLKQMHDILLEDSETQRFSGEMEHGFSVAEAKLQRALERNFDKLELYAQRNILRVPANLDTSTMPTWAKESGNYTAQDEEAMDGEIAELRRKIQTAQYVKTAMAHRLTEYTSELAQCQEVLAVLEEGDKRTAEAGVQDLAASVTAVVEAGKEIAALEGQYASVNKETYKGQQITSIATGGMLDNCLAKCRAGVGAPSTRDLRQLGVVLGVPSQNSENVPPAVM